MSGYFWNFRDKATAKYHGLTNLGSTCYLNSVLQVLFMTKEFRDAVIKFVDENPDTDFIDRHLKDLFDDLLTRDAYTYKIVKRLDIVRVYEQQDAAEYFEKILRLTCPNTAEIFHGQMTHRTTCSVCGTQKDTGGPFWHLPLELVDSSSGNYSVEDGIKTYFSTTSFSGDNQMYCDTCDTKVDATSSYVINNPDVLVLLLKRFDFSYEYMSYVKINRVVDVPRILTIPEKQVYELYAFVEHSGDLRGGHYNATIRPEDDEETWYNFDDSRVSSLDSSPFPDSVNITQSSRAYLLFYKKKQTEDVCTNRDDSTAVSETPDQILSTKNDLNNEERDDKLSGTQKRLREEEDPGQSEKRIKYTLEKPDELEVTDHENADQPEAGQTLDGEDTNTENSDSFSNRNLRSEDQSEARDPEDIEPTESAGMDPDVNQVFKPGDREISGGPAGHERGELSEAHGMLAYRKTDENQHEEEKMETNSEQFVPPAGPEGETSDMKSKSTNEKSEETENKEQHLLDEETKTKHKMERSDSHLQDTTPQNENLEEEHRSLPSTDDKNEGKDSANDELTENKEVEADTSHDLTHVVGVTAAVADGHERQQHTVHTQEDLMDKKAEINGINQKSEHLTAPDMTVNDANTDDPKKDINLSSGGDQIEVSYDERSNQSEADPMTPGGETE